MPRIPNLVWLSFGVLLTLGVLFIGEQTAFRLMYFAIGMVCSWTFLMFLHPISQPWRIDISLCVPLLSVLWPLVMIALIINKPWTEDAWKNRDQE